MGDAILKGHPNAVISTEENLLKIIKQMAVIPVAISVRRADLLNTKQDQGENVRAFYAKVRGKAATCFDSRVQTLVLQALVNIRFLFEARFNHMKLIKQ